MSPVVLGTISQPRTIVVTPGLFSGDENRGFVDRGELPKYAVGLFESNGSGPRKRKRLTHLTPEEKVMRRKLKNRVAAQTARDRKKARMETLEDAVTKIHEQMNKLLDVNSTLLQRTHELEEENMILRRRLGLDSPPSILEEISREAAIIKQEISDQLPNADSPREIKCETSDDEGCVLKSYEEPAVMNDQIGMNVSTQEVTVCRSPVPAAGSCQTSEADPLGNGKRGNIIRICDSNGGSVLPKEEDTDITALLRALQAIDPQQCIITKVDQKGNAAGSSNSLNQECATFNVFSDHGYTKPATEQLFYTSCNSGTTSSQELLRPTDSKKLTALFEETKECTQADLFPADLMDALPYCDDSKLSDNSEATSADFEAVLDSIINGEGFGDHTETKPVAMSPGANSNFSNSDMYSEDSGVSLCGSPVSLDTPSPLYENTADPFFSPVTDCKDFLEGDELDLFPQLSAM